MKVILKMGSAPPEIVASRGDYDRWFRNGCGWSSPETLVIDAPSGQGWPQISKVQCVIVTGSSAMVSDHEGWSLRAGDWLRRVVEADLPVLGVCYGHQLLAEVFGGVVATNPAGREIGTIEVALTAAAEHDPLFRASRSPIRVQATHRESVITLPPNATLLATNSLDPHQAYRLRKRVWCVQFHPEMSASIMRAYVERRAEACRAEGLDPEAIYAKVSPSDDGQGLLRRFAELVRQTTV